MPTSGDLKSGDSLFFTTPPPEIQWTPSSAPPFHNPDKCGNHLGHYIKSYMKYILSKFAIDVFIWCQKSSLSVTKQEQKCPRNRTTNKKNSSFELKWAKSQTKAQKSSKDDFIREIWWPVRETGRLVSYPGDSGRVGMYVVGHCRSFLVLVTTSSRII